MSLKRDRYNWLRASAFTPLEARELSVLPKSTPALKLAVQERVLRRVRFERIAAWKIAQGKWRRDQVERKWVMNLSRMYHKLKLRVKEGPRGKQPKMVKGTPNPWALYRDAERRTGGTRSKGYLSPWEVARVAKGKTRLEKGLIFVQTLERKAKSEHGTGLRPGTIRQWIAEKDTAIQRSKGKRQKQLILERNRLERLLK